MRQKGTPLSTMSTPGVQNEPSETARPEVTRLRSIDRSVFWVALLSAAVIYLWFATASNGRFHWSNGQPGFYDLLAESFLAGHLYLPIRPSAELLALPNPWDPKQNQGYGLHDMALYNRHYYLYHGVTPAWLLFTPYRFVTGGNLPQAFAAFLFCWLGYACACATLFHWLAWARIHPPLWLSAVLLPALMICQSVPFLLQRVDVYEVAVSAGYFCLSAGFWFLTRALLSARPGLVSFAAAGICFGLAPGCRPDLAVAAVCCSAVTLFYFSRKAGIRAALQQREWWSFVLPLGACGLLLAWYNYARFGNPLEFGTHWQIASPSYFRPAVSLQNLVPGLYYLLACTPIVNGIFPFYHLALRMPFDNPNYPLQAHFFREPIVGLFVIWPLTALAIAAPWVIGRKVDARLRALSGAMSASAFACLLLVAALGLASHRFHLDWLPYLVFVSTFSLAILLTTKFDRRPLRRFALAFRAIAVGIVAYSITANLALGIQGPFDNLLRVHPDRYVRYAGWFSPIPALRPIYNPRLTVDAWFEFPTLPVAGAYPLISAGWFGSRYLLNAEMLANGGATLTSAVGLPGTNGLTAAVKISPGGRNRVHLEYEPGNHVMSVYWNGERVLEHTIPYLVTAPMQVRVGQDRAEIDPTPVRFPWPMQLLAERINGVRWAGR